MTDLNHFITVTCRCVACGQITEQPSDNPDDADRTKLWYCGCRRTVTESRLNLLIAPTYAEAAALARFLGLDLHHWRTIGYCGAVTGTAPGKLLIVRPSELRSATEAASVADWFATVVEHLKARAREVVEI